MISCKECIYSYWNDESKDTECGIPILEPVVCPNLIDEED